MNRKPNSKDQSASQPASQPAPPKKIISTPEKQVRLLKSMAEIGTLLNSTLDEQEVRKRAVEAATRLTDTDVGSLLLIDPKTKELYFEVALGEKGARIREVRLKPGEGIAGMVAETGEAQIVHNVQIHPKFFKFADERSGFVTRNMICVPVEYRGKRTGVIQVINKRKGKFSQEDLNSLKMLSDHVAIAIENALLYKELSDTFLSTAAALGDAIEAKDAYTAGHTRRVMEYSLVVGRRLAVDKNTLENLKLAAVLHDIGKIGIEDRILQKCGRLDPDESMVMQGHTVIGARIVDHIPPLKEIIPGIRNHHEKYNGTGYPDQLKGKGIPTIARIISVCDTFDAMTTDRPYRKGLTPGIALKELRKCAKTQFDPKVVEAFIAAFIDGDIEPIFYRYKIPVPVAVSPATVSASAVAPREVSKKARKKAMP